MRYLVYNAASWLAMAVAWSFVFAAWFWHEAVVQFAVLAVLWVAVSLGLALAQG